LYASRMAESLETVGVAVHDAEPMCKQKHVAQP
jgi:hypothetical protein